MGYCRMTAHSTGKACRRSGCRTAADSFPTRCSKLMMRDRPGERGAPRHEGVSLSNAGVFLRHGPWPGRSRQLLAERLATLGGPRMGRRDHHADCRIDVGLTAARLYWQMDLGQAAGCG